MTAQIISIHRTVPGDEAAVRECGDRAFPEHSFRGYVYPKSRAHLSPADEVLAWRDARMRKTLEKGELVHFKCVPDDEPGKIVGYAAWHRPGHFEKELKSTGEGGEKTQGETAHVDPEGADPPAPKTEEGEEDEESFPAAVDVELFKAVMATMKAEAKKIWGENANFWYLAGLAVDPAYQRRGLAKRMVDMGLEWADADGLPTFLEATPDAKDFYQRLGFEQVGEYGFFDGAYVCTFRIRQPGASTPAKIGWPKP